MKPLLIMIGADKGGVGKTTVSRALDDYLEFRGAKRKVFDGEYPSGDLSHFVPAATVVNMMDLNDQMRVFDSLRGVTVVDIKAGLFSDVLASLSRVGLLGDVRAGHLDLMLFHVLGPSASSLQEIAYTTTVLGDGVHHVLVKNYVNESGFKEWDTDTRFSSTLASASTIEIPHLQGRACTEVQRLGVSFAGYASNPDSSRMLRGYVGAWLREVFEAFDKAGVNDLIDRS